MIRRILKWVVLMITLPTLSFAQKATDRPANFLTIISGGLAGADIGQSMSMFAKYPTTFYEANPILRPLEKHPTAFGFAKATFNATTLVLIHKWTEPRSKKRYILLSSFILVQGTVVLMNKSKIN